MTANQEQYGEALRAGRQQYADALRTGQQAWAGAVEQWTKTVQQSLQQAQDSATPVDASQVIDEVFDLVETMLEGQRQFAKNLVDASMSLASARRQPGTTTGTATGQSADGSR